MLSSFHGSPSGHTTAEQQTDGGEETQGWKSSGVEKERAVEERRGEEGEKRGMKAEGGSSFESLPSFPTSLMPSCGIFKLSAQLMILKKGQSSSQVYRLLDTLMSV